MKLADFGLAIEVQGDQQAWFGVYYHVLYCAVFRRVESLGSKAVTNVVLWVLKHPPRQNKM